MKKILIIEDEKAIRSELSLLLQSSGYEVCAPDRFDHITDPALLEDIDLILLDIVLPGVNGEELLRQIRKSSDLPVIMLTSRTGEMDEAISMSLGADDYVTKPYNPTILMLRIAAVLKRSGRSEIKNRYHDFVFYEAKGTLESKNVRIVLTKNEAIIFRCLLDHFGEITSRDEIMTALWDNSEYVSDNALTVNISRLREKLSSAGIPEAITTRKKQGYILG